MSQKERDAFVAGWGGHCEWMGLGYYSQDEAEREALRRYPDETPAPAGQIGCPYYCEGSHVEGERCNCPCHKDETAWLVETADSGPAWWTGTGWTSDSLKAVRYATRDQAEYAAKALGAGTFASEHRWFPAPPEAARRCQTLSDRVGLCGRPATQAFGWRGETVWLCDDCMANVRAGAYGKEMQAAANAKGVVEDRSAGGGT